MAELGAATGAGCAKSGARPAGYQDRVESELLAAGWLERVRDDVGRETLPRVTEAGVRVLATTLQKNRARQDAHEALVARVADRDAARRAGGVARLALRARRWRGRAGATRWVTACPTSIRSTARRWRDYAEPVAHEIKVHRADLLSDLRRPDKGRGHLASQPVLLCPALGHRFAATDPAGYGVISRRRRRWKWRDRRRGGRCGCLFRSLWMALARANADPPDWRGTGAAGQLSRMRRMPTQPHPTAVPGAGRCRSALQFVTRGKVQSPKCLIGNTFCRGLLLPITSLGVGVQRPSFDPHARACGLPLQATEGATRVKFTRSPRCQGHACFAGPDLAARAGCSARCSPRLPGPVHRRWPEGAGRDDGSRQDRAVRP